MREGQLDKKEIEVKLSYLEHSCGNIDFLKEIQRRVIESRLGLVCVRLNKKCWQPLTRVFGNFGREWFGILYFNPKLL
jgi:hypothetical protein